MRGELRGLRLYPEHSRELDADPAGSGGGRRWRCVRQRGRVCGARERAAENQEVTAAKRTDVFDRRDMTRAREEEEVAGAGPRAPA